MINCPVCGSPLEEFDTYVFGINYTLHCKNCHKLMIDDKGNYIDDKRFTCLFERSDEQGTLIQCYTKTIFKLVKRDSPSNKIIGGSFVTQVK